MYEQALGIFAQAYGPFSPILINPLIESAEEALGRNESNKAYAWYHKARALITDQKLSNNLNLARATMGIAQLHMAAGNTEKASVMAHNAIKILQSFSPQKQKSITAKLYLALGKIEQFSQQNTAALVAYKKSLSILTQIDPESREIYRLHQLLVEVNHELGNRQDATYYCKNAVKYRPLNHGLAREPFYDPSGRLTAQNKLKNGHIRATLTKTADCQSRDIEVHETKGISADEAKRILKQAYFAPMVMNGRVIDGEFQSLITASIYANK